MPATAQTTDSQAWLDWRDANNKTVTAERMLSGDVSDRFNMLGHVRDLVLNPTGTQIQYVLYEVPYPYSLSGSEDGFVAWDKLAIERGFESGLDLRIDGEESRFGKDQLELTRREAKNRLVNRIIGGEMRFADGATR